MSKPTGEPAACTAASGANWSAYSLQGRTRQRNSDSFAVYDRDGIQVFALGDGVGSMPGSPLASRTAVDAAVGAAELGMLGGSQSLDEAFQLVDECVRYSLADAALKGATTLTLAVVQGDGAEVASVGDSEVHEVRPEGPSTLLHELDHVPSRPNMLLAWIDGGSPFEPHHAVVSGETTHLCLMSDGVPGKLTPADVARIVRGAAVDVAARELVLAARAAGATDDLTAITVRLPRESDSSPTYE